MFFKRSDLEEKRSGEGSKASAEENDFFLLFFFTFEIWIHNVWMLSQNNSMLNVGKSTHVILLDNHKWAINYEVDLKYAISVWWHINH